MSAREKWLLTILTGIFVVQASVLVYGVSICSKVKPELDITKVCPQLGERFETTFATMVATTLALLTGNAITATPKRTTSRPKPLPPLPPKKDA